MDHRVVFLAEMLATLTAFGGIVTWGIYQLEHMRRRSQLDLSRDRAAPGVDDARFARLEEAVESIASEVQRLTEAQEFQQRLLSDRGSASLPVRPASNAQE
ncbi:MAG: hypothetical protein ABJE10_02980 [bacterium]